MLAFSCSQFSPDHLLSHHLFHCGEPLLVEVIRNYYPGKTNAHTSNSNISAVCLLILKTKKFLKTRSNLLQVCENRSSFKTFENDTNFRKTSQNKLKQKEKNH